MRRFLKYSILVLLLSLTRFAVCANADFPHGMVSMQSVYPTQAAVMQQIKLQAQALVGGIQAGGAFQTDFTGDDISDDQWGAVALLAYWWSTNGGSAQTAIPGLATAAQQGLDFALANRDFTADPKPTDGEIVSQYISVLNSGQHYSKYHLDDSSLDANYEATALSLVYKDMILQYGQGLFTAAELASVKQQAYSNWTWYTTVSVYNPENTANQVMIGLVGGYWLGKIYNDQSLMTQVVNFYNSGAPGTNNTLGYRNTDRITTAQGYSFFTEHRNIVNGVVQLEGFDTHYGGLQLSDMVEMIALMGGPQAAGNVYTDALAQAAYSSDRLSQAGTMHGGSRHNEVGGSTTDVSPGAGYSYFGSILQADLGRVILINDNSTGSGHVQTWGHRASEIIFLHQNFVPWITAPKPANDLASLRAGNVSIFFDNGNQPQEISVAGTVLTDALHNAVKAQGLDIRNATNVRTAPAIMSAPTYAATQNYTLHTTTGSASTADISAGVRHYYVTNGTILYIVTLVHINAPCTLNQLGNIIGLPNLSSVNRIVNVNDVNTLASVLDFSQDSGSYTGAALQTGNVRMDAWPQIVAENVSPNGNTWMSTSTATSSGVATWNQTLEQLGNAALGNGTRIYYYPNGNTPYLNTTDDIRANIQPTSGNTTYAANDLLASVIRIAPTAAGNTMTVTPVYAGSSTFKISQITISEPGQMSFQLNWGAVTFTDLLSGEVITSPELLNQSISVTIPNHTYGDAPFTVSGTATSALPVAFSLVSGPATLSGNTVTLTGAGSVTVKAVQAGNSIYQAASALTPFTVAGAPLTLSAANATITYGAAAPAYSGTIAGVLGSDVVTETFSANTPAASPIPAGTYTITPSTTGAAAGNYINTVQTGTLTVSKAIPALVLSTSNANVGVGASVILTAALQLANGSATGTVNFMDGSTLLGSAAATVGNVTFTTSALTAGAHTLTAVYSGDANLNGVTSAPLLETITAPSFQFTPAASALTLSMGQSATIAFTLPSAGNYAHTVTFTVTGLPWNVTAQVAPASLAFTGANDTKTTTVTFTRSAVASLRLGSAVITFALLLPFILRRRVRARPLVAGTFTIMLGAAFVLTLSGCSSGTSGSTTHTPATYTVQISATDGTATLTAPVTLTLP